MRLSNKQIIGLDINNRKIKFAQIRHASGEWLIEKSGAKSVPHDEDASPPPPIIAKIIRELFEEYEINAEHLVSAISGKDAVIKIIKLPALKQAQKINEIMDFELSRHIPLNIQETAHDYQVLHADDQQITVLLAATRRDTLEEHLAILSLAGIIPVCVMPSSIMLANAAIACSEAERLLSAFVNVTDTTADVVVLEGEILHHARSFVWRTPADSSFQDKLLSELQNTLSPYQLKKVSLLIEDDVGLEITQETVKSALQVEQCEICSADCELAVELAKGYVLPHPYLRLNLQKPILDEQKVAQKLRTRQKLLKVVPVLAMLILMAISFGLWRNIDERQRELAHLKGTQQSIKQRQGQFKELRRRNDKITRLTEELRWAEVAYPALSHRLYQIATLTPDAIWLKEVSTPEAAIPKKKLTRPVMSTLYVTGYAHSQMDIDQFMQNLKKDDCFAEVGQKNSRQVFKSGEVLLEFQLAIKSARL